MSASQSSEKKKTSKPGKSAQSKTPAALLTPHLNASRPEHAPQQQPCCGLLAGNNEVDRQYVISRLKQVVERCLQTEPVKSAGGKQTIDEQGRAVYAFNPAGANKALELLGKTQKLFSENVNIKTTIDMERLQEAIESVCLNQ